MNKYKVGCEATQDCGEFEADSPADAIAKYLDGYETVDAEGDPVANGELYSTLNVWQGEDVVATKKIVADGNGGVKFTAQ